MLGRGSKNPLNNQSFPMVDIAQEMAQLRAEVAELRARVGRLGADLARFATPNVLPDGTMRRRDAARALGVSLHTMNSWARRGDGPPFRVVSGRAYYRRDDLEAWVVRRARASAAGAGGQLPLLAWSGSLSGSAREAH
jgi:hypothetical protein